MLKFPILSKFSMVYWKKTSQYILKSIFQTKWNHYIITPIGPRRAHEAITLHYLTSSTSGEGNATPFTNKKSTKNDKYVILYTYVTRQTNIIHYFLGYHVDHSLQTIFESGKYSKKPIHCKKPEVSSTNKPKIIPKERSTNNWKMWLIFFDYLGKYLVKIRNSPWSR